MRLSIITCFLAPALVLNPLPAQEKSINPVPVQEARLSWKMAADQATSPDMISVPEGFEIELLRSATDEEGSWITLEFDDRGHLFVSKEEKGILRFRMNESGDLVDPILVEDEFLQARGLLWAYDSLYVNENGPMTMKKPIHGGLHRLQDEDNDGVFEKRTTLLKTTAGSPGHGRNQMKLGPDGLIYFISGYDVFLTDQVNPLSPLKNFQEDQLIPNPWDEEAFNKHGLVPGGRLMRTDENGSFFQILSGGLRNAYDIDFNKDGEIFTYDADMEWDAALAWYRPTRILHLVSGADFGWRRGFGKLPPYYADSLPATVDVGLGSPTGVEFGYRSNFPGKWKNALYCGDWTYGRILAVHLDDKGASYTGKFETFASGRPMNVVDLTFGPDGNLYFVTGGMKTRSGIYRMKWVGPQSTEEATLLSKEVGEEADPAAARLRKLRYQLEFFHVIKSEAGARLALQNINHKDKFIRHAARIALENQEGEFWAEKILRKDAPEGYIALARSEKEWVSPDRVIRRLNEIPPQLFTEDRLLDLLRAYQVHFIRRGKPEGDLQTATASHLTRLFPHSSTEVNHELCELLVYLEDPKFLPKLGRLIEKSESTEDLSQYLVFGRYLDDGWDEETKRIYLQGVQRLESFPGGQDHQKVVGFLRDEMLEKLDEEEKTALAEWIKPIEREAPELPDTPVSFVRSWEVEDFQAVYQGSLTGRNFEKGKIAYTKGNCVICHQMYGNSASSQAVAGPDLTNVGGRFGLRDLLVSIVHPSRAINDKYRNPAAPNLSTMPPGQINMLEFEEVIDLLAYLQSGGKPDDRVFQGEPVSYPVPEEKVEEPEEQPASDSQAAAVDGEKEEG